MAVKIEPSLGDGVFLTQQGVGASPGYSAIDIRRQVSTLSLQSGVIGQEAFLVKERKAGANMSVDVEANKGFAAVEGTTIAFQGLYEVSPHKEVVNLAIAAANETNPRIDQVILRVFDNVIDSSAKNEAVLEVLAGTPTSGATLENRSGAAALPASAIRLADVLVPAKATTIVAGDLRDRRPWARGVQAIALPPAQKTTSTALVKLTGARLRVEHDFASIVVVTFDAIVKNATLGAKVTFALFRNGVEQANRSGVKQTIAVNEEWPVSFQLFPSTGGGAGVPESALYEMWWGVSSGEVSMFEGATMTISELVAPAANNGTA